MSLTLKIISFKGQPLSAETAVVFDTSGGTIGRAEGNTLMLPDPEKFVSRRHAYITFENGHYLIKDSSLSGTYVDDQEPPLNNATQALVDGMHLRMGEYEIEVSIAPESQADDSAFEPDLFAAPGGNENPPSYAPSPFASTDDLFASSSDEGPHLDSLLQATDDTSSQESGGLLHPGQDKEPPSFDSLMQANISTTHDSYIPPGAAEPPQSANEIPEDFNFEELFNITPDTGTGAKAEEHGWIQGIEPEGRAEELLPGSKQAGTISGAPVQAQTVAQPALPNELLTAFLQGAGIDNTDLQGQSALETMRKLGLMFRKLVEGTLVVLRSRAEFKSQFRVSVTTIKTTDNNPLKFAVTTEDALTHLVKNGQGGFKGSVEAIDEGFNDIMSHQMAMQAGIQASLEEILKQFDPKRIEKQFEEGLVLQKKSKCWDKYSSLYPRVVEQAMEDFFGEAFAEAYEKQMKQLHKLRSSK